MNSYDLEGRVSLVTGGAMGIGRSCCEILAKSGAVVIVADRDLEAAEATAEALNAAGGSAHALKVDVAESQEIDAMVAQIVERFGALHVAVNNAGVGLPLVPIVDVSDEAWRRVTSINLDGVLFSLRAEIRAMQAQQTGVIVNIASVLGCVGAVHQAAYVASKHGVLGLTKVAALETAAAGIRVNAIAPGRILTPLLQSSLDEEALAQRAALAPMNRIGEPREVGDLVAWLASDASSFVTGATFTVDGGFLAQ